MSSKPRGAVSANSTDFPSIRGRAARINPLAMCLSAALLGQSCWPVVATAAPPTTWQVKNCDDDGADSLRDLILNYAQSGDIIDLSQVPALCGMSPSTITLGSEIVVAQDDLKVQGPVDGAVEISGNAISRVFHHSGVGTLTVQSLTISDGYYHLAVGSAYGGCIESDAGDVTLIETVVTGCVVKTDADFANGGGVGALLGNVGLLGSTVSGNQADSPNGSGWGGGIYAAGTVTAKYSSITGNSTEDLPGALGNAGGISSTNAVIAASTLSGNTGGTGGGLAVRGALEITDSTISENVARVHSAVTIYDSAGPITISNSTIAFNHEGSAKGAVFLYGTSPNVNLTLQSSILANSTAGAANTPSADLYIAAGYGVLDPNGTDNLVMSSNIAAPPAGVITANSDPMLGPLQLNGGLTPTHMLLPGSPALTTGNNSAALLYDQRAFGYPRMTGPTVDMGAVQFDTIFVDGLEF